MKVLTTIGTSLLVSLFIGGLVSWSGGSIFPPLYNVAAPFVCNGEFNYVTENFYPRPGETATVTTIICRNPISQTKTDITGQTVIVAGLIYSALVFLPVLAIRVLRSKNAAQNVGIPVQVYRAGSTFSMTPPIEMKNPEDLAETLKKLSELKNPEDPAERLKKLNEMKDAGLITEDEYQAKRTDILAKM